MDNENYQKILDTLEIKPGSENEKLFKEVILNELHNGNTNIDIVNTILNTKVYKVDTITDVYLKSEINHGTILPDTTSDNEITTIDKEKALEYAIDLALKRDDLKSTLKETTDKVYLDSINVFELENFKCDTAECIYNSGIAIHEYLNIKKAINNGWSVLNYRDYIDYIILTPTIDEIVENKRLNTLNASATFEFDENIYHRVMTNKDNIINYIEAKKEIEGASIDDYGKISLNFIPEYCPEYEEEEEE